MRNIFIFRINKQKCTGCQVCLQTCPGATKMGVEGKAEVINQNKLKECGGEKICPFGAIEKTEEEPKLKQVQLQSEPQYRLPPVHRRRFSPGRARGTGRGRRWGRPR